MQTSQGRMLASLVNVQQFLDEHAAKLTNISTGAARTRLDTIVKDLSAHVAEQTGSHFAAQGLTKKQRTLRLALLRDHMRPIARIARADLPDTPEVQPLKIPRGNPSNTTLVAIARGMAKAALPFTSVFVLGGLSTDFVARLELATDVLSRAASDRSRSHGRRGGATSGLRDQLKAGRKIVGVIDALVKSAATSDPAMLADWSIVQRVQRSGGRSAGVVNVATDPTAATSPVSSTAAAP